MLKITIIFIALSSIVLACSIPKILEHNHLTKAQKMYWNECFKQDEFTGTDFCCDLYIGE